MTLDRLRVEQVLKAKDAEIERMRVDLRIAANALQSCTDMVRDFAASTQSPPDARETAETERSSG